MFLPLRSQWLHEHAQETAPLLSICRSLTAPTFSHLRVK